MRVLSIEDENFDNYKKPAMLIGTISCSGKCCIESNLPMSVCQNDCWRYRSPIDIPDEEIIYRYQNNNMTSAIVFGGLEPFEQWDELIQFISKFRIMCDDDIVIYTGYNKNEIAAEIIQLALYKNIILKFGRYVPDQKSHYDEILGVDLISDNQYGEVIS